MRIEEGKLIWDLPTLKYYSWFQKMVMMHIDKDASEDDGIEEIVQRTHY